MRSSPSLESAHTHLHSDVSRLSDEKKPLLCCSKLSSRPSLFHAARLSCGSFTLPVCQCQTISATQPNQRGINALKVKPHYSQFTPHPSWFFHLLKAACLIFSPLLQVFLSVLVSTARVLQLGGHTIVCAFYALGFWHETCFLYLFIFISREPD